MNAPTKPASTFKLEAVHPDPSQAHKMPYAPAIKIVGACDLMFLSGATASPLYHNHPHQDHEHIHPHSIEEQTKNAMNAIQSILESVGASWKDVIKVTKYLTDFREADAMHKTMHAYFGDWLPASTTVCINQLSSPGARIELDMIVALPKSAEQVIELPERLRRLVEAEYPRFSDAEMDRRRAAMAAAMAEAGADHLVFYGANRAGSCVQWLTQWPVTAEAMGVFTPGKADALFVQWINHAPLARKIADKAERVEWGGEATIHKVIEVLQARGAKADRVAVIGPMPFEPHGALSAKFGKIVSMNRAYSRLRAVKSAEELDWLRIGAAYQRRRHGGAARQHQAGGQRARTRQLHRARLRRRGRRHRHPLHRRDVDAHVGDRRAAAISVAAQGADGRRGGVGDHRDVLRLWRAGAAQLRGRRGADAALSQAARRGGCGVQGDHRRAEGRRNAGAGDRGVAGDRGLPASRSSTICCTAMAAAICNPFWAAPTGPRGRCRKRRSGRGRRWWCSRTS